MFKSGYITVVGKPNAGKSTLVNKMVGFKVAITTPKPQTTRFNIKGIITDEAAQMVFIDTPGVHVPKDKMGEYMMKNVESAIESVDVVIYMVDATKPTIDKANETIMQNIATTKTNVILCINKIDKIEKGKILKIISIYDDYFKSVGGTFNKWLPEGDLIYGEDEITDITEREIIEETIREKALNNLQEEVPHGIKVEVEKFKKRKNRQKQAVYDIDVNIICEKASHKGIIIGKDGAMLKKIGSQARVDIEDMLDDKVNLQIWVKVRPDWQDNENYLQNIKSKIQ